MVFVRRLIYVKKILLCCVFFCLQSRNIIYASVTEDTENDIETSYSQATISEELGLTDMDNDDDNKRDNKKDNTSNYYQQPYQQQYQQPMPIIVNLQQPYQNSNDNGNRRNNRKNRRKSGKKDITEKEKYLEELKAIKDKTIFANDYSFGEIKKNAKSYRAFTFNFLNLEAIITVFKIIKDWNDYKADNNEAGEKTGWGFFLDEFCTFPKGTNEQEYMVGKSVPLWIKIVRSLTNVKWEWKSIKYKHFALGFELAHLIFPTLLLEFNTGYDKPDVFGGGIKFGISCGIGGFLTFKKNNFYVKIDTPCLTLPMIYIAFRNGKLSSDESNKRKANTMFGKSFNNTVMKFLKSFWTFERVNANIPIFSDEMKKSSAVDGIECFSIGFGWIYPKVDLFEY